MRREISEELRLHLTENKPDREKMMALSREYGRLDGTISAHDSTAFAAVGKSLREDQRTALVKLRDHIVNAQGVTSCEPVAFHNATLTRCPSRSTRHS